MTFGITNSSKYDSNSHKYTEVLLESIWKENIPDVEIIACGDYKDSRIKCIEFEGTISKKLNVLIEASNRENIVLIRDYMKLRHGFWKGFEKFGFDWDLAMCVIINKDYTRFRDWCVWIGDDLFPNESWTQQEKWTNGPKIVSGKPYLPPYTYKDIRRMYISGGLFIGKKQFFLDNPFNNDIDLGEGEDVHFFDSIRDKIFSYKMNTFSSIKLQKQKDRCLLLQHPYFGTLEYIKKDLINEKND